MLERVPLECQGDGCDKEGWVWLNYPAHWNIMFNAEVMLCDECSIPASLKAEVLIP